MTAVNFPLSHPKSTMPLLPNFFLVPYFLFFFLIHNYLLLAIAIWQCQIVCCYTVISYCCYTLMRSPDCHLSFTLLVIEQYIKSIVVRIFVLMIWRECTGSFNPYVYILLYSFIYEVLQCVKVNATVSVEGAPKLWHKIIFVFATKLGEKPISILNCYFSKQVQTLIHQTKNQHRKNWISFW